MGKKWFYGIEGIEFIWRGNWSDPMLRYRGHIFNYWDVENGLFEIWREDNPDAPEIEFEKWVPNNAEYVRSYMDELWEVKDEVVRDLDAYLKENIREEEGGRR